MPIIGVAESKSNTDAFERIKTSMSQAGCVEFDFLLTVESSVFEQTDSSLGTAILAADGRYRMAIGPDLFLFDGDNLYSYSEPNNQVVIETPADADEIGREISFITNLDRWYQTRTIKRNYQYSLARKNSVGDASDLPDSMTVYISEKPEQLDSLVFLDINEDRNVVFFISQSLNDSCGSNSFVPDFPDSADVVRF